MDLNARNEDWERHLRSIFRKVIYLSEQHLTKWVLYYVMKTYDAFENKATRIAVIGGVVTGKSTLINALVGDESIIPIDEIPCTWVPTVVKFASNKRVFLKFANQLPEIRMDNIPSIVAEHLRKFLYGKAYLGKDMQIPPLEIPFDNLDDYNSLDEPPESFFVNGDDGEYWKWRERQEKIRSLYEEIEVCCPSAFLENKLELIETAGLTSLPKSERVILDCLRKSDITIFLIDASCPFAQNERSFIEFGLLPNGFKDFIMVVSKIDLIGSHDEDERQQQKAQQRQKCYIAGQVCKYTSVKEILAVSADQAIIAIKNGNSELFEESGIPKLADFLTEKASLVRTKRNINCAYELKTFLIDHVISNINAVFLDDQASPLFVANYLQNLVIELDALIAEMKNSQPQEV